MGLLCVVVMLFVPFAFAGCNGASNTQYSNLQELYNDIVLSNDDIFGSDGTVNVVYNNASLVNLINANNSDNQFNKLSGDSANSYAIFEPTFRASMLLVKEFIKKPYIDQSKFDKRHSEELYGQLTELESRIAKFKETKARLEGRQTIDVTTATVKSWRDQLFLDYYNMIDVACDFSLNFANFYENNVLGAKKVGDKYTANYLKLKYLTKVTEFARITTDTMLYANYNRVVVDAGYNMSVDLMNLYLTIPRDKQWIGDGSLVTDAEKNIIQAFDNWQNYDLVFNQSKVILYNALGMEEYNAIMYEATKVNPSLSTQQRNVIAQVDRFVDCEVGNMVSYMNTFTTKLIEFMNN